MTYVDSPLQPRFHLPTFSPLFTSESVQDTRNILLLLLDSVHHRVADRYLVEFDVVPSHGLGVAPESDGRLVVTDADLLRPTHRRPAKVVQLEPRDLGVGLAEFNESILEPVDETRRIEGKLH